MRWHPSSGTRYVFGVDVGFGFDQCDDVIDMVTFNSLDANITQQKCSSERHVGLTITLTFLKRAVCISRLEPNNGNRGALPILRKTTSVSWLCRTCIVSQQNRNEIACESSFTFNSTGVHTMRTFRACTRTYQTVLRVNTASWPPSFKSIQRSTIKLAGGVTKVYE